MKKVFSVLLATTLIFTMLSGLHVSAGEYEDAVAAFNDAVARLNAAKAESPEWEISGEVIARYDSYIIVFGYAKSKEAYDSHPGWASYSKNNLKIYNVNWDGFEQGDYYHSSGHYYQGHSYGVGIFGQTVDVLEYGADDAGHAAWIQQLKGEVDEARGWMEWVASSSKPTFTFSYDGVEYAGQEEMNLEFEKLLSEIVFTNTSIGADYVQWYVYDELKGGDFVEVSTENEYRHHILGNGTIAVKLVKNGDPNNYDMVTLHLKRPICIILNDVELKMDVEPITLNDRTMVPARFIFEALGADVNWDAATQTVTGSLDKKKITMQVGNPSATVDGKLVTLDAPPVVENDRTFIPLRFCAENLDCKVNWLEEWSQAIIYQETSYPDIHYIDNQSGKMMISDTYGYNRHESTEWGGGEKAANGDLYYLSKKSAYEAASLMRRPAGTTEEFKVADHVGDFRVAGNEIFYIDTNQARLPVYFYRMDLDGQNKRKLRFSKEVAQFVENTGKDPRFYDSFHGLVWNNYKIEGDYVYGEMDPTNAGRFMLYNYKTDTVRFFEDTFHTYSAQGDLIYYSSDNGIFCIDKNEKVTKLTESVSHDMYIVGDWIYFANENDGKKLYRMKKDGSGKEKITDCEVKLLQDYVGYLYLLTTGGDTWGWSFARVNLEGVPEVQYSSYRVENNSKVKFMDGWIFYYNGNSFCRIKPNFCDNSFMRLFDIDFCTWYDFVSTVGKRY